MFLHHIFNPPSNRLCDACKVSLEGAWYNCKQCPEFDLCEDCYRNRKFTHDASHTLERHTPSSNPFISLASRQRRRRQLEQQSQLLVHVMTCRLPRCNRFGSQCSSMRQLWFEHAKRCPHRASRSCDRCNFVRGVLVYHRGHCRNRNCPVPQCRMENQAAEVSSTTLGLRAQQSQREDQRGGSATNAMKPEPAAPGAGTASGSANGVQKPENNGKGIPNANSGNNHKNGQAHKENNQNTVRAPSAADAAAAMKARRLAKQVCQVCGAISSLELMFRCISTFRSTPLSIWECKLDCFFRGVVLFRLLRRKATARRANVPRRGSFVLGIRRKGLNNSLCRARVVAFTPTTTPNKQLCSENNSCSVAHKFT